eukprot:tig00021234_g19426.t1
MDYRKGDGFAFHYGSNMSVGMGPDHWAMWDNFWEHRFTSAGAGLSILFRARGYSYIRVSLHSESPYSPTTPRPQYGWGWVPFYWRSDAATVWHNVSIQVQPNIRWYWRTRRDALLTVTVDGYPAV